MGLNRRRAEPIPLPTSPMKGEVKSRGTASGEAFWEENES
jgi:hypothetical protein